MPELTIIQGEEERCITFVSGRSLRHILDATDARVRSGCRGMGACGLCLVRIQAGKAGEPTPNERMHLGGKQLAQGIRLACQVTATEDLHIELVAPAPKSTWRSLPHGEGRRDPLLFP